MKHSGSRSIMWQLIKDRRDVLLLGLFESETKLLGG